VKLESTAGTRCQECGRPWGWILARGEQIDEHALTIARDGMIDELLEQWACDHEPDELELDRAAFPPVYATEVVFVTEALGRFADELGFEGFPDLPCWTEVRWLDVPAWLLKGRRRRSAIRWDCCNLAHPTVRRAA
jgi:hypothetical protein